ncbi:rho GTPase-activating protein 21 isoform X3 [Harmonia axyridis]|uniref:rho GTPase-activating protein 21 isoform X3 n=1 Tax=Harmonia axyridis TaxID=115357 RepID=UPI001E2760F6|nr:rho GTPase-activating protein 21 isoform X3 [Harmonia axyridis]
MADDGRGDNATRNYLHEETFHRTQEAQAEHKFPNRPAGIISLPPGCRGPKSLYLKRVGGNFGFTLRHFIIYPPDGLTEEDDGRLAAVGALHAPMETIFVRKVKNPGPAHLAGLQKGDRIVAVNGIQVIDKPYSFVIQLIQKSPAYLHLLVVPKEEDALQRLFTETAYNPVSNQNFIPDSPPIDRRTAQQFLTNTINQRPGELQVDAQFWRSLRYPFGYSQTTRSQQQQQQYHHHHQDKRPQSYQYDTRYSDNASRRSQPLPNEIYTEIQIHDAPTRHTSSSNSKAQPQVPLYKKMGRRASDGTAYNNCEPYYDLPEYTSIASDDDMVLNNQKPRDQYNKTNLAQSNANMSVLTYPSSAGCRLSLADDRRESTSSLTSSYADGSKDSLSSFETNSTLTGQETDDSAILSRYRRSFQQKEEFLKMPTGVEPNLKQREFYGRPKKLEKPQWPPGEPPKQQDSPSRTTKPTHHNFQRVKHDIDNERDLTMQQPAVGVVQLQQQQKVGRTNAPASLEICRPDNLNEMASNEDGDDKRVCSPTQLVFTRTRQFESGKPLPEDDPLLSDRTSFYKSELSKISSKRLVPNVTERAQEYEIRAVDPRREVSTNASSSSLKKIQRDSRSLDSSGSCSSINEMLNGGKSLSGNVIISTGSKFIHCPPPSEQGRTANTDVSESLSNRIHFRSNSADSWTGGSDDISQRKLSRQDTVIEKSAQDEKPDKARHRIPNNGDLSPLIPEPVKLFPLAPLVSVTPAYGPVDTPKPIRPTRLDLDAPVRPMRYLKPPRTSLESPIDQLMAEGSEDRITRRESYLKATEGSRLQFECDLSDGETSPQVLRSAHRRWRPPLFPGDIQQLRKLFEDAASSLGGSASENSSSSTSLERDKGRSSPFDKEQRYGLVVREGPLNCKITELDGKRPANRSWRQTWAVLRGPKLFLYKDRNHQSPIGTSDLLEQSFSNGVDIRTSLVRVAEDYTKRKHVLRVSSVNPCRSELLLQAENSDELADWVKVLNEQGATATEVETKLDLSANKQQAVPQSIPALTSIQVQGSRLSPLPIKSKAVAGRNRSPTGQSPVSKTRKPSQHSGDPNTSPKSKTWRGRVAKQFRKIQGASSPSSPTAPEGSTFGVPLEQCLPSCRNHYVPKFVEICTDIVDERGLQTIGIYRVPGNNASITALSEEVNRNYEDVPTDDARWTDVHVVSSLLKSFFRKLPDSLVTNSFYLSFIRADKIENPKHRMQELKRLIKHLPPHNYHTLKHLVLHLNRVMANSEVNKMDAKNVAIVFGPNIVRPEEETMAEMVSNNSHQCKILVTLLNHASWFFSDSEDECDLDMASIQEVYEETEPGNQQTLLESISKLEAMPVHKEKNGALFSSIISAAQRKVKRKTKGPNSLPESKEELPSPTGPNSLPPYSPNDLKDSTTENNKTTNIPTTVRDIETHTKQTERVPWFNYATDQEEFQKRIEKFKNETQAMLTRPRCLEITVDRGTRNSTSLTTSSSGTSHLADQYPITKTHSVSSVFPSRVPCSFDNRNSLNSLDNNSHVFQYNSKHFVGNKKGESAHEVRCGATQTGDVKNRNAQVTNREANGRERTSGRRNSSIENLNSDSPDGKGAASLKKVKYENQGEFHRTTSLDSMNKCGTDDDTDLVSAMTKLYDKKLEDYAQPSILTGEGLPYADESPEKTRESTYASDKENRPCDLYKNPSLHKYQYNLNLRLKKEEAKVKEAKEEPEKDEDSSVLKENVPDNERHLPANKLTFISNNANILNGTNTSSKLKRSESLNKPERTVSPMNNKVKRSESLNKAGDKLKRSDSLTKTEKTESNISKRRELITKKSKELKRKNGMPDRSIKRRHTVGGTKDPDKVTLLDKYQEEVNPNKEDKEKNVRTSSPDLSSTRREKLLFEINLIGPENMVVALRQHLIGNRPQSFPESTVFKVPLESHV